MSSLPTFVVAESFVAGQTVTLGEEEAHHIRVRRIEAGQRVGLLDGLGTRGEGVLVRVAKRNASVEVDRATLVEPLPAVHLLLPVADRDRMLWLAEKATELGATSWRPVLWRRSRSVNPRGEGPQFHQKVLARMASALGQSGGAWLPTVFPDATPERAIAASPGGVRLVCDGTGAAIVPTLHTLLGAVPRAEGERPPAVTIAVGPEGGFEEGELRELIDAGFVAVRLGGAILRFETAAVSALAVGRAALDETAPTASAIPEER